MMAAKFGASLRDVLWTAQAGLCWICSGQMHRKGSNHPRSVSLDHIWPKARFGDVGDIGVTLLACRACNSARGNPAPDDADVRTLVSIWRRIDARWLRWSIQMLEADVKAIEVKRSRVDLLRMLAA